MLNSMVSKINKLAAYMRLNRSSSIPDIHICNMHISNITDNEIETGNFQQGTDELTELLINAIQGRYTVVPLALPNEQSPTKDWIVWLLSKGLFRQWTCRQREGDLILAQAKLSTEEVFASIFPTDTGMRHSKRIKERHENEQEPSQNGILAHNECKDIVPATHDVLPMAPVSQCTPDTFLEHRTHMEVDSMATSTKTVETPSTSACRNINTFLGSEVRKKATDKKKFKYSIGSPLVGTLRIGSVQIDSQNYDKLCEIIPLWKTEKYDYLAITDTRCTSKEVVQLKKLMRQLNPGDLYWFSGVTEKKMAGVSDITICKTWQTVPALRGRHKLGHLLQQYV